MAADVATDLAEPDGREGTAGAVMAVPGEDVAVAGLGDGKGMTGALVRHGVGLSRCVDKVCLSEVCSR